MITPVIHQSRRPDATFYPSGRIDIGASIVALLDLHHHDVLGLAFDEEGNIMLYRRLQAKERLDLPRYKGILYSSHIGQRSLRTNVVEFTRYIFSHYPDHLQPIRFTMGDAITHRVHGTCVNLVVI